MKKRLASVLICAWIAVLRTGDSVIGKFLQVYIDYSLHISSWLTFSFNIALFFVMYTRKLFI